MLALRPFRNFPFLDDWVYAWSVEHLLKTGELRILDISTSINPVQVLWGALFCLPAGFSFAALQFATWCEALICLWGLYLSLRTMGVERMPRFLAVATLGLNPIFFVLSHSFMTDVLFISLSTWSMLYLLNSVQQEDARLIWPGLFFAVLALGTRLTAVALIPPALLASAVCAKSSRRRWQLSAATLGIFSLALLGLFWWHASHTEFRSDQSLVGNSLSGRIATLWYTIQSLTSFFIQASFVAMIVLGIALVPLTIGQFSRSSLKLTGIVATVALAAYFSWGAYAHDPYVPLSDGQVWSVHELGASKDLLAGYTVGKTSGWIAPTSGVIAIVLFSAAFALFLQSPSRTDNRIQLTLIGSQLFVSAVLWLLWDRYALPLVIPAILVTVQPGRLWRPTAALLSLLLLAAASGLGMHDHLRFNQALWDGIRYLEQRGVPTSNLNAGYVPNGWLQYAHPEHVRKSPEGNVLVEWVNAKQGSSRYILALSPSVPGTVLTRIPFRQHLSADGGIYVIDQALDRDARGGP